MDPNVWWGIGSMIAGLAGGGEIVHILRRAWLFEHPKAESER